MKPWRLKLYKVLGISSDAFNSATAVKPWRRALAESELIRENSLQFGHGGEAVETRSRTDDRSLRVDRGLR